MSRPPTRMTEGGQTTRAAQTTGTAPSPRAPSTAEAAPVLVVDPIACDGHGLCAEILPEWIGLDDWGYPIIPRQPVPLRLRALAERAVKACPTLALRLQPGDE